MYHLSQGGIVRSENVNELAAALAKAQGQMRSAPKDGLNPHFKNKYATLDSIWDTIRGPLSSNGLSVVQSILKQEDMLVIATTLMHSSGQWIQSEFPIVSIKATPQAIGSALTYMRRYSLASIVGATSGEDDDAEQAEVHAKANPPKRAELITIEEAQEIENSILPGDSEYRKSLLDYFGKLPDFTFLPKEKFDSCMKAVIKRKSKAREL
jgi:hypothetical protein